MSLKTVENGVIVLRTDPRYVLVRTKKLKAAIPPPYILRSLHAEYRAGRTYELMAPFVYVSAIVGQLTVPTGFITDFHSVARGLWNILPPDDWAEAAVAHDALYRFGKNDDGLSISRLEADQVHRECNIHVGAPKVRAEIMYRGLRLFSGGAWERRRAADVQPTRSRR